MVAAAQAPLAQSGHRFGGRAGWLCNEQCTCMAHVRRREALGDQPRTEAAQQQKRLGLRWDVCTSGEGASVRDHQTTTVVFIKILCEVGRCRAQRDYPEPDGMQGAAGTCTLDERTAPIPKDKDLCCTRWCWWVHSRIPRTQSGAYIRVGWGRCEGPAVS